MSDRRLSQLETAPGTPADAGVPPQRRTRLRRDERERMILDEAIRFFGEHGLEGQTRALAERLGITQPLLYRYFPDKDALIARVYEEVMIRRWSNEWDALLADRSRPLAARLTGFYLLYCRDAWENGWIRFVMFAGLKGTSHADPFITMVEQRILATVCAEARAEAGLPPPARLPLTEQETELAWAMHAAILFIAVRKSIFRYPLPGDVEGAIAASVSSFLGGLRNAARSAAQQSAPAA